MHDLVENVTEERYLAGRCAARYVKGGDVRMEAGCPRESIQADRVRTKAGKGVRYVVPHLIRPGMIQPESKLLFRVTDVYRNAVISLRSGGQPIYSKKKVKAAPGEMESIKLTRELLEKCEKNGEITVQVDEA